MTLLITNATVLTFGPNQRVIENGAVAVRDNLIEDVGPAGELEPKYPAYSRWDAGGRVVMPGLTNAHHHLYSTLARGMALKDEPARTFQQILERLWWRLDKALDEEAIYYSAVAPLISCIRSGVTAIIDHHASPNAIDGSLDILAGACGEVGVRACLCYEVTDRDGPERALAGIRENVRFIERCRTAGDDMLSALFGLHASFTLSDETLSKCREASAGLDTGFHIHVSEGPEDLQDSLARSGERVVERLHRLGILGPKTVAAHCIHLDDHEIGLLRETGTFAVHNPQSNMGNAVGYPRVLELMAKGVTVGLGTDGYTSDMIESIGAANTLHKFALRDPRVAWGEIPTAQFINNPDFFHRLFPHRVGQLSPGAYADLIVLDYFPPTPLTPDNFGGHLLFGLKSSLVHSTMVDGKWRMADRRLVGLDEAEIAARSREVAKKVWERF